MRKLKTILGLFVVLVFISSCSKWIAPPYTSVDKIIKVKAGMSIEQVNSTLGIEPYDIYQIQEDGSSIYLYHYRKKDRRMLVPPFYRARERAIRGDESAQTAGNTWYGESALLYVHFKDNKLKSVLSDAGRRDAQYLLLTNNNIQVISRDELTTLQHDNGNLVILDRKELKLKNIDIPGLNKDGKTIAIPMGLYAQEDVNKKKEILDTKSGSGKIKKVLLVGGGIILLMIIISAISS